MFRAPTQATSHAEFVTVMAFMMALAAMSTDIMLPALGHIHQDLPTSHPNDRQMIIVILFFGMACGQMLWGPLSDSFGRRVAIHSGSAVFMAGCLISILSQNMEVMLLGRFCQGLGAASARVVTMAMIRDRFSGEQMARVLSVIMSVFILIPMLAPAIGQAILWTSTWRMIFVAILIYGLVMQVWFFLRQPETLGMDKRSPFTFRTVSGAFLAVSRHHATSLYTLCAVFVFGFFVGYLSFSQQLFQEFYATGDQFALYFAILALSIGIAMFANSLLISRYGMHRLSLAGLIALMVIAVIFLILTILHGGKPPFEIALGFLFAYFLPIGMLFINMNTLAIEPHGRIAGMASTVINTLITLGSLVIGIAIAQAFKTTLYPLAAGALACSILSLGAYCLAVRQSRKLSAQTG
ncbi:MAG: multidrug effflux MFS transporter [Gammaproteobacteria bacterium]|nr:multidrug effflux MFS transporter [Gammaproteobacteria bacterium]MCY4313960.1 multidrug effflux MFS transporter [Gammaproteobacteria bacterium]